MHLIPPDQFFQYWPWVKKAIYACNRKNPNSPIDFNTLKSLCLKGRARLAIRPQQAIVVFRIDSNHGQRVFSVLLMHGKGGALAACLPSLIQMAKQLNCKALRCTSERKGYLRAVPSVICTGHIYQLNIGD